jgi:hypothetical protein
VYCTVADVRAYEPQITETAYPEGVVTEKILLAVDIIDNQTGQWFEERETTFTLAGHGINDLCLPVPAISITSVTIDEEELDSEYYKLRATDPKRYRFLRHKSAVWPDDSEIEVVGKFGYVDLSDADPPVASVPAMAKELCCIVTAALLLKTDNSPLKSETIGGSDPYKYERIEGGVVTFMGSERAARLLRPLTKPKVGIV